MNNKISRIAFFLLTLTLVSCGGNGIKEACIEDDGTSATTKRATLTEWKIVSGDVSENYSQPQELDKSGLVEMGARGDKLGAANSRASKAFKCGTGNKCSIHISTGDFSDNEKLQIVVTRQNQILYQQNVDNSRSNPLKFTVQTCKGLKIQLSVSEGDTPGVKSKHNVKVTTQCLDCG